MAPPGCLVARPAERTLNPVWTVVRFSLCGDARAYRDALEILSSAGFRGAGAAAALDLDAPFPASVVGEVRTDPADATRAVFEVLREAGLRPTGVSATRVAPRPAVALVARA